MLNLLQGSNHVQKIGKFTSRTYQKDFGVAGSYSAWRFVSRNDPCRTSTIKFRNFKNWTLETTEGKWYNFHLKYFDRHTNFEENDRKNLNWYIATVGFPRVKNLITQKLCVNNVLPKPSNNWKFVVSSSRKKTSWRNWSLQNFNKQIAKFWKLKPAINKKWVVLFI